MRITWPATAVLFMCISVNALAEQLTAYENCQRMLTSAGDLHATKSNSLRDNYQRRIDAKLQQHPALRTVIERIVELRHPDEAYGAYVVNAQTSLTTIDRDEAKAFECPERKVISATFEANRDAYEVVLELIEQDIDERLEIEQLGGDEGLLIIAFNTSEYIDLVRINRLGSMLGAISFGPVHGGQYFKVIKAKAGKYSWDEITRRFTNVRYMHDFSDRDYVFTVERGKLNYAGVFLFEILPGGYFRGSLNDRQTIVTTILEQTYPELLNEYEIANGLYPDDRFIESYLSEKSAHQSSTGHD